MKNTNFDQSDLCQVGNLALSADGGENDQGISIIFKHDNIKMIELLSDLLPNMHAKICLPC